MKMGRYSYCSFTDMLRPTGWKLSIFTAPLLYNAIDDRWCKFMKLQRFLTRDSCTGRYCWERVLAMWILPVCLSVLLSRPGTESSLARSDRDTGFSPYDSLELIVSSEVIWCRRVRRFPSNEGIKKGYPLRNRNFTTIRSSSVRMVSDRHRLAAYHNKHCWRSSFPVVYQQSTSMTLNDLEPKIGVFSEFFAISGCNTQFNSKLCQNQLRDRPG